MSEQLVAAPPRPASPRKPTKRLTGEEVGLILKLRADGLTQTQIAQRLDCDQKAVCNWLAKLTDSTDAAKSFLRGSALRMAENIIKKGLPRDHVAALKGLDVLNEDTQKGGVTVIVGGRASVQVNVGSDKQATFASPVATVSLCKPEPSGDLGSDNTPDVN